MATTKRTMTQKTVEQAIIYFSLAIPTATPVSKTEYKEFVELGLKSGYLPHPAVCTPEVKAFLKHQRLNPNSTFWKTWEDVTSRSQEELFLHACIHYLTTYGTNYSMPAYVPNDDYVELPFTDLTVILPATATELAQKAVDALSSGIALSESNVSMMVSLITIAVDNDGFTFDVDSIQNREAKIQLYRALDIVPNNPIELLRFIVFEMLGTSMLIKSKKEVARLAFFAETINGLSPDPRNFSDKTLKQLASIFYRFKPLFLALRKNPIWRPYVNTIRRLAKTYHKPMKAGVFESLMSPVHTLESFTATVMAEKNIWKLFRAYSYLAEEAYLMSESQEYQKAYIIRNGKIYTKKYVAATSNDTARSEKYNRAATRLAVVMTRIMQIMNKYRETSGMSTVRLPKDIHLTVPVSEKMFIGNIPFGSYFDMDVHNYVGVYWRNEWGTYDYDLSFINVDGSRFGWNTYYTDTLNSVIFSGDMTNADPEATEMFYCKKALPDGFFKLNRYNGQDGSRARLFFGSEPITKLTRGYMVDPSTIKFKTDIYPEQKETIVAGVFDNRMYICNFESGNTRVSTNTCALEGLKRKAMLALDFETLLTTAGYVIVNDDNNEQPADLDFTNYTKDQFITFFSEAMKFLD